MRFDLFQQAELFELFNDRFTGGETLHATVSSRNFTAAGVSHCAVGIEYFSFSADVAVEVHDVNHGQLVAFTDFIVVEVMRRGDFHTTGAFFHIRVFITEDRNAAVDDRQNDFFTDQIFVTRIFRVNGHAGITEHGFRTRGGDHQVIFALSGFRAVRQRITDMPHEAFDITVFHFQVRNCGVQFRVPVHQTFTAVNQVIFIQADKRLFYGS